MKNKLLIIVLLLICAPNYAQKHTYVCDDNKKTVDLGTTHDVYSAVADVYSETSSCSMVKFIVAVNNNKPEYAFARPVGSAIEIKDQRVSNEVHVTVQAIEWPEGRGQVNYACTNADGEYVFLTSVAMDLLTEPANWCHGLPISPSKSKRCSSCGEVFFVTTFLEVDGKQIDIIHNGRGCPKSISGNHSDMNLSPLHDCGCFDVKSSDFD